MESRQEVPGRERSCKKGELRNFASSMPEDVYYGEKDGEKGTWEENGFLRKPGGGGP